MKKTHLTTNYKIRLLVEPDISVGSSAMRNCTNTTSNWWRKLAPGRVDTVIPERSLKQLMDGVAVRAVFWFCH